MSFSSKQATAGGTDIKTTIIGGEHVQNVTLVDQTGVALPIVGGEPDSSGHFAASFPIVPTTLTTGLNYFIIRNPNPATPLIKISKICFSMSFSGTAAASRSVFAIKKLTGVSATTGTAVTPVKLLGSGPASTAEIKQLATGLTATGGADAGDFMHAANANQLNAVFSRDVVFEKPIVLAFNEAIVLQSLGTIVAGTSVALSLLYYEL